MKTTHRPRPARAHYMLRYHAPLDDFDRHLHSLLRICRAAEIGEVMFMIEPEERSQGFPTLERLHRWAAALRRGGAVLRRHGIEMSINVWMTLGHGDRGWPPPKELGLTPMVGDDGTVAVDCGCPADPAWHRYVTVAYATLASANPHILWADDDFRLHNHVPVRYGCFAQPMLDAFAKRTGRKWTRRQLVGQILANNNHVRAEWMRFTGDLWNENAARIRRAIHRVNPAVRFGLMTSSMSAHSIEGRRWPELLKIAAGPHRPVTRPHFGYGEGPGHDLATQLVYFRIGLAFLGRGTRCCAELENYPFSPYARSRRVTTLQMELMEFFGTRDLTLDVFQTSGNDPANEPWVVRCLREARPRLDAIAALGMNRRREHGVHLWTHPRAAEFKQLDHTANGLMSLWPNFQAWGNVCARLGVAATFETRGDLTLVCGDAIRAADRREILRLLMRGVFLDGRAAFALQEMGYGRHLGVEFTKPLVVDQHHAASLEVVLDEAFGLPGSRYLASLQLGDLTSLGNHRLYLARLRGARAVSEIQSASLEPITPCLTLHENTLGGRVAVFAYDFDSGIADAYSGKFAKFYNRVRKCQLLAVLRWLSRGRALWAALEPGLIMLEAATVGGWRVLAIVNLSGDPLPAVRAEVPGGLVGPLQTLDESGRWRAGTKLERSGSQVTFTFRRELPPSHAAFFRWKI